MKEFFKKNWKLISIISSAVVAAVVTIVLCVCLIPKKGKQALDAPAITCNDTLISWNEIVNADKGYTVKINSDETTVVLVTEYDLANAGGLLKVGENKISVKANATDAYGESKYSNEVVYTLTAPQQQKFTPPANLKIEDGVLTWNAVSGATNGYTVKVNNEELPAESNSLDISAKLVEGDNVISVMVKAVGDKAASDYCTPITYKKAGITPFGKIENLHIEQDTAILSWTSVAGATNGYTLFIGETQFTVTVTSVNLLEAPYADALVKGDNTLTVIINATEEHTASEPSNEAVYNYDISSTEAAEAFKSAVEAIGTDCDVDENSTKAQIEAAEEALTNASKKYEAIEDDDDALAVDGVAAAKTALDEKAATVNALTAKIAEQIAAYKAAVEAAEAKADPEQEEADFSALQAAYGAVAEVELCNATKSYCAIDYEAYEERLAAVKVVIDAVEEAAGDWNVEYAELSSNENAEANIVAAGALIALYENEGEGEGAYAPFVKLVLKADYEKAVEAKQAAQGYIESYVNGIKTAVEAAVENTTPNETNYSALEAQKAAVEGVDGAYATEYLSTLKLGDDGLLTAVEKAMETMLATVVDSDEGEAYSLTGTTLKITLFRTFYNFRNEKIATTDGVNAPKLTVDGNTVSVEQDFEKNELNEYVAIINIENLGAMGENATYTVTVGSDDKVSSLKFGETLDGNPYFTDGNETVDGTATGFKKAVVDGNFAMTFQAGCAAENYYLEVYNADAITKVEEFVKFTEMPLGKIDVTGKATMKMEEFNRLIANSLSDLFIDKNMTVRFMIYGKSVTEDGVPSFTAMNASVISEAIEFNLVEADKYYTLPVANIDNSVDRDAAGTLSMIVEVRKGEIINAVNSSLAAAGVEGVTLTEDNYKDYLQMKIEIYDTNDENETVLYTKYAEIGFRTVTVNAIIEEWQKAYFTEHGDVEEPQYKIGVRVSYWAKPDTEISKYFPRANFAEGGITYEGADKQVKYEKEITLSKAPLTLPDTGMRINGAGNAFEFLRDSVGAGKILSENDALYLEIKFYLADGDNETNVNYAYLFNVDGTAVIYKNKEDAGKDGVTAKQAAAGIGDSYIFFDGIKDFFRNNYTVDGFPMRWDDGWTFTAKYARNPESTNYLFEGGWSIPVVIEAAPATNMPAHVQIGNDGNGNITFIRKADGSQDGTVFTEGGAERVEYYFYAKDGEKSYDYCIFMKYNKEDKTVALYYNNGEEDVRLAGCGAAADSWCESTALVGAMNTYLAAMHAEDGVATITAGTLNEWTFVSKIVARAGNKVFIEEELESTGSWTYSYVAPAPAEDNA